MRFVNKSYLYNFIVTFNFPERNSVMFEREDFEQTKQQQTKIQKVLQEVILFSLTLFYIFNILVSKFMSLALDIQEYSHRNRYLYLSLLR